MPGTSSAKTRFALLPGHDEVIAINATSVKSIPRPFRRALRTLRRNACFDFIRGDAAVAVLVEPQVFAIPKASSEDHAADNAAAGDLVLGDAEIAALDKAFPRGPKPRGLPML